MAELNWTELTEFLKSIIIYCVSVYGSELWKIGNPYVRLKLATESVLLV